MKTTIAVLIATMCATIITPGVLAAEPDAGAKPALTCETGPLQKELGKSQWLVYGCQDRTSAIVVPGNEGAGPFYVKIALKGSQYRISGEGGSVTPASTAALSELQALPAKQLRSLVEEANKAH